MNSIPDRIAKIMFTCWQSDEPIEIQLEPEAIIFVVKLGNELTFVGNSSNSSFHWTLRIDHRNNGIQLFPECSGTYRIEVFENNVLLDDWYKYM